MIEALKELLFTLKEVNTQNKQIIKNLTVKSESVENKIPILTETFKNDILAMVNNDKI